MVTFMAIARPWLARGSDDVSDFWADLLGELVFFSWSAKAVFHCNSIY
jgi:hypothetical protein